MALVRAGFTEAETWEWSLPKLKIRACIADEMRLHDALLTSGAVWEPGKVQEQLKTIGECLVGMIGERTKDADWETVSSRVERAKESGWFKN